MKEGGRRSSPGEMEGCSWGRRHLWRHLYIANQYGSEHYVLIVVPESAVRMVLEELHENLGHAGQNKLEAAARQRFGGLINEGTSGMCAVIVVCVRKLKDLRESSAHR
ncbi:hypothetical protein AHF37_10750 [Paragonimus kellicotti]|nr:hypothetical protein AHF37_10750 [Paragonimus kellicotti]